MGIFRKKTETSDESKKNVDWNEVYVELDNEANGTVAGGVGKSAASSGSKIGRILGASSAMEDSTIGNCEDAEAPSQSYTALESEDDTSSDTEAKSNINTVTSGTYAGNTNATSTYGNRTYDSRTLKSGETDVEASMHDDYNLSNNHFANAQLMRWKHAAEQGPPFLQILAFLSAIASILTTVYPLVIFDTHWTVPMGVCAYHTIILCCLIIAFEIRAWGLYRNPVGLRARFRNMIARQLNILKMLWGRGLLYMFAGSMNIAMNYFYAYVSGLTLMGLGILAIMMGAHASFNLERLRLSLTDHAYLWSKFVKADEDHDSFIDVAGFSELIWGLGLELDDEYTYRAFSEIDTDGDKLIDFDEFKSWWVNSQDGDETVLTMDMTRFSSSKISKLTCSKLSSKFSNKIPKKINAHRG